MDLKRALRRTKCLFFGGFALLFLALMPETVAVKLTLAGLGVVLTAGGAFSGWWSLRCPRCGASLMAGGRIPMNLPNFCPRCGKPL